MWQSGHPAAPIGVDTTLSRIGSEMRDCVGAELCCAVRFGIANVPVDVAAMAAANGPCGGMLRARPGREFLGALRP
jgi:hypothetical protein